MESILDYLDLKVRIWINLMKTSEAKTNAK